MRHFERLLQVEEGYICGVCSISRAHLPTGLWHTGWQSREGLAQDMLEFFDGACAGHGSSRKSAITKDISARFHIYHCEEVWELVMFTSDKDTFVPMSCGMRHEAKSRKSSYRSRHQHMAS